MQAEKAGARDVAKRKAGASGGQQVGPSRGEDELDLSIENTMTAGAVRSLKGNGDEETHDDREQQDHYQPQHAAELNTKPRLDVKG